MFLSENRPIPSKPILVNPTCIMQPDFSEIKVGLIIALGQLEPQRIQKYIIPIFIQVSLCGNVLSIT